MKLKMSTFQLPGKGLLNVDSDLHFFIPFSKVSLEVVDESNFHESNFPLRN